MAAGKLASIQYVGEAGSSKDCLLAVLRFIQFGDTLSPVRLLTAQQGHTGDHCLLIQINGRDFVAVKSGFTSGYAGEGPKTLSELLAVLDGFGIEVEEYRVEQAVIDAIDASALSSAALDHVLALCPVRPWRLYEYELPGWSPAAKEQQFVDHFPLCIPYAAIDARLMDLAITFWEDPDAKLLSAFRRLEDIVRQRTGIEEVGGRLFSDAFGASAPRLEWVGCDKTELSGRVQLFAGTYMVYRNPRAHREFNSNSADYLCEFLVINTLYRLEAKATPVAPKPIVPTS